MPTPDIHILAYTKANEIEAELRAIHCWADDPLPIEKFENMGAFGCNTMTFAQWLQFVLIPRIRQIVMDKDVFPSGSMLAVFATREFDGDTDKDNLLQLLYELDELVNESGENESPDELGVADVEGLQETLAVGDIIIPSVVFTLASVLPKFEGDGLESQLQTYDTFLAVLPISTRPIISDILSKAADRAGNPSTRERIKRAAESILQGGRAAEPYDHEAAMKKYMEDQKKSFPS